MINNKTQIDATTYEVEFSVDAQQLQTEKKRLYRANVARYNVPGFRKGKAPMNVIERMYGPVFTQEAVENLYNKNVDLVVTEFG